MEITTLTSEAIYYNTPYWKLLLKVSISATFLLFLLWMTNFFSKTTTNCCPAAQTLTSTITTSFVLHESPLIPANQITLTFAATTDYLANPGIGWQETKDFAHPNYPKPSAIADASTIGLYSTQSQAFSIGHPLMRICRKPSPRAGNSLSGSIT